MGKRKIHPYIYIIMTFVGVILIGTALLALPISSKTLESFGFIDSFFMATSCVCVTGLSVMPNGVAADMTVFGKVVMVFLMEIGGLSIITIAVFFFTILGAKIGLGNRLLLREALNQNTASGLLRLVKKIMLISFTVQIMGTLINWYPIYEFIKVTKPSNNMVMDALGMSIYHSAAAFNNAGFDIFGAHSMEDFASNAHVVSMASWIIMNTSTMLMIILGGLGFVVIDDVFKNRHWRKLTLHTKITIIATAGLIFTGGFLIKLTSHMGWMESFFTSVTARTAGFATYNMANLKDSPAAYMVICSLMLIGASPCSTGGGIKTTTFAVIIIAICYFARGRRSKAFKRRIPQDQTFRAFILFVVAVFILVFNTFLVSAIQPELGISEVFFEITSAFSTTGLSMGITTSLNGVNRLIVSAVMLLGRLGPLTVIGVLNKNWVCDKQEQIQYVEESVMIG